MKKIYFLILALLLANSVIAQNINFGFKGGFNISTQNFDPNNAFPSSLYTGFLVGFHAGTFVNIEYQSFTIQPGLFYTTKGDSQFFNPTSYQRNDSTPLYIKKNYITP